MNIINYLENKREELMKYKILNTEDRIELDVVSEILLYSQLNQNTGKTKFKVLWSAHTLEAELSIIIDNGGTVLDVQITSASQSVSVSSGDRDSSMHQTMPVEFVAVIKYLEK